MERYFEAAQRRLKIINLDPAAEIFGYNVAVDIRDLISLEDVAEELDYGPNGGLVFCMEHLAQNLDWLRNEFDAIGPSDDEYFIVDCPGQIELFTHIPVMRKVCDAFKSWDISVCGVYLIDALFIDDPAKYISGTMMALSTMVQLEIAHINVISKCDLKDSASGTLNVPPDDGLDGGFDADLGPGKVEDYLVPDTMRLRNMIDTIHAGASPSFKRLHEAICSLIDDYTMVNFVALNIQDDESIELVLAHVDNAMQYGEDLEPKEPKYDEVDDDMVATTERLMQENMEMLQGLKE
uniref:GPN-loop GTPase 3 n=1 Tax=Aplanochytrium stocchinoi TaxID=215587 RepID=A0A6S8G3P6_9STRA